VFYDRFIRNLSMPSHRCQLSSTQPASRGFWSFSDLSIGINWKIWISNWIAWQPSILVELVGTNIWSRWWQGFNFTLLGRGVICRIRWRSCQIFALFGRNWLHSLERKIALACFDLVYEFQARHSRFWYLLLAHVNAKIQSVRNELAAWTFK